MSGSIGFGLGKVMRWDVMNRGGTSGPQMGRTGSLPETGVCPEFRGVSISSAMRGFSDLQLDVKLQILSKNMAHRQYVIMIIKAQLYPALPIEM